MIPGRACCGDGTEQSVLLRDGGPWLKVTDTRGMIVVSVPGSLTKAGSEALSFHGLSREPV